MCMAWVCCSATAVASVCALAICSCSVARTSAGASLAWVCASSFEANAPVNSGSLELANCSSVTSASAIWSSSDWLLSANGCSTSPCPCGLGAADSAPTGGGFSPGFAAGMGVTGLGGTAPVSGAALAASSIGPLVLSRSAATWLLASPFMPSSLLLSLNSSASSAVLGAISWMRCMRRALKAAPSNSGVGAFSICPAWLFWARPATSAAGISAAAAASLALSAAGACSFSATAVSFTRFVTP